MYFNKTVLVGAAVVQEVESSSQSQAPARATMNT